MRPRQITFPTGGGAQSVTLEAADGSVVNIDNTATATEIFAGNVPALGADDYVEILILFDCQNINLGSNATFQMQATLGSTEVFNKTTANLTSNASRRDGWIVLRIYNKGATNSQGAQGTMFVGGASGWTGNLAIYVIDEGAGGAEDMTSSKALSITMKLSQADADFEFRKFYAAMKVYKVGA